MSPADWGDQIPPSARDGGVGGGTVNTVRVLVVDDEVELAEAVARGLRREGYAVDVSNDGDDALDKVMINTYDLLCLDITMPGTDGREVCRKVRATAGPQPRILMLTARDGLDDRVSGLDDGADDYLVKPFAFPELLARVRSLLRRDSRAVSAVTVVGELELDDARHEAKRGVRRLDLTSKEFALLRYFMPVKSFHKRNCLSMYGTNTPIRLQIPCASPSERFVAKFRLMAKLRLLRRSSVLDTGYSTRD